MKNNQKGFIMPLLLGILALLVIGGGIYVYKNKKSEESVVNNVVKQMTEQNNTVMPSSSQNNQLQVLTSNWKVYINDKLGFQFKYPVTWHVVGKIGPGATMKSDPILFDGTIETENSSINRVGHISVFSFSLDTWITMMQKDIQNRDPKTFTIEAIDFRAGNFQGKKYKMVYFVSQSQQTDYDYAVSFGDKTIFITFTSVDNNSQKQISTGLLMQIDQFVGTLSTN